MMKMNQEIKLFDDDLYFNGHRVRVLVDADGEPWWVAKNVCEVLDIRNVSDALGKLDDDEKADVGLTEVSSNGVEQNRIRKVINEPGLYSLILRSHKAEAKRFKRWVTHEVLPEIRKHGQYMHVEKDEDPELIMARAITYAQRTG